MINPTGFASRIFDAELNTSELAATQQIYLVPESRLKSTNYVESMILRSCYTPG